MKTPWIVVVAAAGTSGASTFATGSTGAASGVCGVTAASGAGVGVVSEAEFGHDPRVVKIPLAGESLTMDEALICLRERAGGKLVKAFMDMATKIAEDNTTAVPVE